jgi:hypothetical protein
MSGGPGPRDGNEENRRPEGGDGTPAPSAPPPGPLPWSAEASPWHGPSGTDTAPGVWPSPDLLTGTDESAEPVGAPGRPGGSAAPVFGLGRRRVWSVVMGAAGAGVAVSLVLALVGDGGDGGGKGGRAVAVPSSASGPGGFTGLWLSPSGGAGTGSPSASAPGLPAGYQSHDDPEGFRIAYPDGWTRSTTPSSYGIDVVDYRSADRTHRLQVYQVSEASPAESFERYLSDRTPKPDGFRKIALDTLDALDDGTLYAIVVYGPGADDGADQLEPLTTALSWFCPPDAGCSV